jgi:hypothetical protein
MTTMPAQLLEAHERWKERAAEAREARFDDFLFMIQQGDSAEVAARRVGTNALALIRQAQRWRRQDITSYLGSAAYRQRHGL